MLAQEIVQLGVCLMARAGMKFRFQIGLERLLSENLARQADRGAEVLPVAGMGHVVEQDLRRGLGIGRTQADRTARL